MSFKSDLKASLGWDWDDGAVDNDRLDYAERFLEGNGDNQAEAVWHTENETLSDGTSTTLDVSALTRTIFGETLALTLLTVRALLIVSHAASEGELLVGDAAADPWSEPFAADGDQLAVPPGSPMLLANRKTGWPVDASNKNLKLSASGGDVVYSIAIVGTTTASSSGG
ncbi:MAG: hypothetical protein JXB62_19995 [Pirellulales bacterium]|nr:hypothetical protein [Pirellulales bacterium]